MSELFLKICGASILCAMLILIIRQSKQEMSIPLRAVCVVVLTVGVLAAISPVIEFLTSLLQISAVSSYAQPLLKALAVAYLTHICASVCRDCGENSIANFAELGGKIEILLISLPLIKDILEQARKLLEMI